MKLVLHIGPNKTGSTLIQNVLRLNCETLARHGIYYGLQDTYFSNHNDLYSAITSGEVECVGRIINQMIDSASRNQCNTIIVSHESFWDIVDNEASIRAMERGMMHNQAFSDRTTIIVSRGRKEWMSSYCRQLIRNGRLDTLSALVQANGLYSLLARSIIYYQQYSLRHIGLSGNVIRDFAAIIKESIGSEIKVDETFRNQAPKAGISVELLLGLCTQTYLAAWPANHPNCKEADTYRSEFITAAKSAIYNLSEMERIFEELLWEPFLETAEKNIDEDTMKLIESYGFI